jgi:hypothetical protein
MKRLGNGAQLRIDNILSDTGTNHHVGAGLGTREKLGELVVGIATVSVCNRYESALGASYACLQGAAIASVGPVPDNTQRWDLGDELVEDFTRSIGGGVVNDDDFVVFD